jgi:NAD(P)-dependent dehydrogenase (short-subunit alcohol dehydrogenase family)
MIDFSSMTPVRRYKEENEIERKEDSSPEKWTTAKWTTAQIPPQWGRLAIVTGGASGLGYETALALAVAGADVVIADRDDAQAHWAVGQIRSVAPAALVRFEKLNLAELESVASFAERLKKDGTPVDLLVNNAGIFALPRRQLNSAGIEMQFAVNYLGPFALTGMLLPLLAASPQPRAVQVSSISYSMGSIQLDDLQMERGYSRWKAYLQSKLALILFTQELARRSRAGGWRVLAAAAHPGYARTRLFASGPGAAGLLGLLHRTIGVHMSHTAEQGALPTLYAATASDIVPGGFYGPTGPLGLVGAPDAVAIDPKGLDCEMAQLLWERSEQLTGVMWPNA